MSLNNLVNPAKSSQKQFYRWSAPGCSIRPMGNYLKALGLLGIVPKIKGDWQGCNFAIESELTPDEIVDYILNDYQPSAICTPWNGSSGFYRQMPSYMTDILKSKGDRFERRSVYQISQKLIRESGFTKGSKNLQKAEFIDQVRSKAIEASWNDWLNVVSVPKIVTDKLLKRGEATLVDPAVMKAFPGLSESAIKLALKCQNQRRQTIQALADLKNPEKPTQFIKNYVDKQVNQLKLEREDESKQFQLGETDNAPMDIKIQKETERSDRQVETLEAQHGTQNKRGKTKKLSNSQNSFKHGLRSKDAIDMNQEINQCLNELKEFLDGLDPTSK